MKKLVSFFFASLLGLLTLSAQKQWAVGDIMEMDGMRCLVIEVDESGTRGKIMSPPVVEDKKKKKIEKDAAKAVDKMIKKGEIDASARENEINKITMSKMAVFGYIPVEKVKGGVRFKVDEWHAALPAGWRLPNLSDIAAFCRPIFGGLGSDHKISFTDVNGNVKKYTADKVWQENILYYITPSIGGIICGEPSSVQFMSYRFPYMSFKCYAELRDKIRGKERTVAVKDFGGDAAEMNLDSNGK